jgi:hypothetical protein
VTDFDITLDKSGMQQRLGELVSQRDGLVGTGWDLAVGTVGEGNALLDGIFLTISVGTDNSVLGDVVGRHLELGLLLQSLVGRVGVGIESKLDILLVGLVDGGRQGAQSGQDRVGNRQGELLLGGQRGGECDAVVLDGATLSAHSRSSQRIVRLTCMCQYRQSRG